MNCYNGDFILFFIFCFILCIFDVLYRAPYDPRKLAVRMIRNACGHGNNVNTMDWNMAKQMQPLFVTYLSMQGRSHRGKGETPPPEKTFQKIVLFLKRNKKNFKGYIEFSSKILVIFLKFLKNLHFTSKAAKK